MPQEHTHRYAMSLAWEPGQGGGTTSYQSYSRTYRVAIAGKPDLFGSADPTFRGDAALYNPEDMLMAALSACHMLSFLALAARARLVVVGYTDEAQGTMVTEGGGGHFTSVMLRPRVVLERASDREQAHALHHAANKGCFIAASCNFPIHHEPTTLVLGEVER